MTDPDTGPVALVRLEGKIDALSAKLDGRLDAVMAKIEAGDRESLQLFELQKSEMGHVAESVRTNTQRITNVALESLQRDTALEKRVETLEKETSDVSIIRRLIYGFVALVLIAVVTGLLTLIVLKP